MAKRLFSSESVTEGIRTRSPTRSATASWMPCSLGTRVPRGRGNTGHHRSGRSGREVDTRTYVDIPRVVRKCILDIGYDSSDKGFDGQSCGVSVSLDRQSPDIRQGVDDSWEERYEHSADPLDAQGAGDQGLMFGYACTDTPRTDAAAHRAGPAPEQAVDRGAQAGGDPLSAARWQGAGDHRVRRNEAGRGEHRRGFQSAHRGHRSGHPAGPGHRGVRDPARARRSGTGHRRCPRLGQPHRVVLWTAVPRPTRA